ncbi:MAG TPA: glycine cleavage system aminomethyltransferase GcvT [Candidatus Polarisedimenticolia bacterium]|nr:glycine cleavage system aminomethyltransferase GcvT [Candidatus Polarisedimenticolia bacterium]
MTASSGPRRTPLHALHVAAGARMVDFAGWDMPVQYAGVIEEHIAVRRCAGLFDVSHMGEIVVRGPSALEALQRLTCNDASRLSPGMAQYSALTTEAGTPVDDVLVYRLAPQEFLLVVNAANDAKDVAWVRERLPRGAEAEHASERFAQIALQGPSAEAILAAATPARVGALASFRFLGAEVAGVPSIVARTGYTGEDGFEIYCAPGGAEAIWQALTAAGKGHGLQPAGLGARDTLRLEACLPLYGQDIDETTSLLEAGLGFIVRLDKGDFLGREALARQKEHGVPRRLAGFEMVERGVARHGYPVAAGGDPAGQVTSGTYAPFLRKNIGLVYLPAALAREGQELDVIIRARPVRARVVRTPFYKRPKPVPRGAGGA